MNSSKCHADLASWHSTFVQIRPWAQWSFPGNLKVIEVFTVLFLRTWNISFQCSHNCHCWTGRQPTPLTLIESCTKSSKNEFNFCICSKNLADNTDLHVTLCPLHNDPEQSFTRTSSFSLTPLQNWKDFSGHMQWTLFPCSSWMPGSS